MTPFLDQIAGRVTGPLSVPPLLPVGAVILGTVAATLAAYAPARAAARLDTVDALAGRTPPPRPAGALARWGLVASALGLGLIAYATISKSNSMLTVGMFLGIGGFLFAIPFLVTLVGRIATRLPLGARIAARDTARHGRRTGPAVAAATLALILPIAVATATLSADAKESGTPAMADDQLVISIPQTNQGADAATVQAFLARLEAEVLPGAVVAAAPNAGYSEAIYGVLDDYGGHPGDMPVYAQGPPIDDGNGSLMIYGAVVTVGGPDLLYTLHAEASTQHLNDGYAVVLAERVVDGGIVRVENPFAQHDGDWTFDIPAVEASPGYVGSGQVPDLVISPERAVELGFEAQQPYWVMVRATEPIADENLAAAKELASTFPGISVRGLTDTLYSEGPLRLIILAFTGVIALAIIGVAVALVAAESRRDQAILAAVGASPRTRRAIAGNRALLLTLLAAILAVPAGFLPITVIQTASNNGYPIVFPWSAVAVVLILLPLLAGLAAGFASRQPSETQMLRPIS
jgi:putative ABC transport system permease protein